MKAFLPFTLLLLLLSACVFVSKSTQKANTSLRTEKLIAWSIVAFDSLERSPLERIRMVKKLGFRQYAFGGRPRHIACMEEELRLAEKEGVHIPAVWLYINHKKDSIGKLKPSSEQVFDAIKNTEYAGQIWTGFHPQYIEGLSQTEALKKSTAMIGYLCKRADSLGCRLALYNHGGWYGEPANQLAIIQALPQYDIGVVYNFHHGHEHLGHYEQVFDMLLPHLWCVSLNGMRAGGPKILTIGKGDQEKAMIQALLNKGYKGPFAILGHVKGGDARRVLLENLQGLHGLGF